jgi:hypothetical protein
MSVEFDAFRDIKRHLIKLRKQQTAREQAGQIGPLKSPWPLMAPKNIPGQSVPLGWMNYSSGSPITNTPEKKVTLPKSFIAGPILAHRRWRIYGENLSSLNFKVFIEPGVPQKAACLAVVRYGSHGEKDQRLSPYSGCTCGHYAYKRMESLAHLTPAESCVDGLVALWGKIIEHELGYRAEYAYPHTLWEPKRSTVMPGFPVAQQGRIEELAVRYGIAVAPFPSAPLPAPEIPDGI